MPNNQYGENGGRPDRDIENENFAPLYTTILLVPDGFQRMPRYIIHQRTALQAELRCILFGLQEVIEKWAALDQYLGRLLVEDFMDLKEYVKLLFDDENFTRSRLYFWAIGCLNEFDISIADNIKQWDLYYAARLEPVIDGPLKQWVEQELDNARIIPPRKHGTGQDELLRIKARVKNGLEYRETLVNLQAQFKNKLETVKALRDGVCAMISRRFFG